MAKNKKNSNKNDNSRAKPSRINLSSMVRAGLHVPSVKGDVLYTGLTEEDTHNPKAGKLDVTAKRYEQQKIEMIAKGNTGWINIAEKGICNSPNNVHYALITYDYTFVKFHKPYMNGKTPVYGKRTSYNSYITEAEKSSANGLRMHGRIDRVFENLKEEIKLYAETGNRRGVEELLDSFTGSLISPLRDPVCSNIELIAVDPTILMSKTFREMSLNDRLAYLQMAFADPNNPNLMQAVYNAVKMELSGTRDTKAFRNSFKRLTYIVFAADLDGLCRAIEIDKGRTPTIEDLLSYVDGHGLVKSQYKTTYGIHMLVLEGADKTTFACRPGIYSFDLNVLYDYAQKIRDSAKENKRRPEPEKQAEKQEAQPQPEKQPEKQEQKQEQKAQPEQQTKSNENEEQNTFIDAEILEIYRKHGKRAARDTVHCLHGNYSLISRQTYKLISAIK